MESEQIIIRFIKLLENPQDRFDASALQDLPNLEQMLDSIAHDDLDSAADALIDWSVLHPKIAEVFKLPKGVNPESAVPPNTSLDKTNIYKKLKRMEQQQLTPQPESKPSDDNPKQ